MPSGCAICAEPVDPPATSCTVCGFPTALGAEAERALAEPVAASSEPPPGPSAPNRPHPAPPPDPQSELCERLARQIDRETGTLLGLGGDPATVGSDLRQAALSQADNRVVEALGILRQTNNRLLDQIEGLFEARIEQIRSRSARLKSAGVGFPVDEELARIREGSRGGDREAAIRTLLQLDERLTRLEGDFTGLQGLLRQIESLRVTLQGYAPLPAESEQDIARVRSLLASTELTPAVLDEASEVAARTLMVLHERLPPHLEAELGRHGKTLEKYRSDHPGAQSARTLHAEAVRHLRRGRLPEVAIRLAELRQALEAIAKEPAAAPPPPPAEAKETPSSLTPSDLDVALQRLLAKARGLAARVRRLPPESEVAFEAASAIRQATELLRSHKLQEADDTLTRLMQTLAAEPVGET